MGQPIAKPGPSCGACASGRPPGRTHAQLHRGGCDCGAVRYELEIAPSSDDVARSPSELTIRARAFRLLSGDDCVSGHAFASWEVFHFYCEHCGVRSFSRHNVEQRGAEFYTVDLRYLDVPRSVWES